jgi:predicted nucleic acid-binding protein
MSAEVPPPAFVDTNIWVCAIAGDDPRRSVIAQDLVRGLMAAQALRTSTQVLQELYVTVTRKVRTPLEPARALCYLDQIAAWPSVVSDYGAVREAVELSTSASLSLWDAPIVVAAARSGATRLYSEDMQDGRRILGVTMVDPFREALRRTSGGTAPPAAP